MVDYGSSETGRSEAPAGLGDPITVARETRPRTGHEAKWTADMAGDPAKIAQARRILDALADEDLATWGFARDELEAQLDSVAPGGARHRGAPLSRYTLQRRLLVRLRRNIHHNAFGRVVRRVRFVCDVLLR